MASPSSFVAKKQCVSCRADKTVSEFSLDRSRHDGLCIYCKSCRRLRERRRYHGRSRFESYGLTPERFSELAALQGDKCAICDRTAFEANPRFFQLSVDHHHATEKFRGLLCSSCNLGIGNFGDDPARLRRAAEYLELAA